MNSNDGNDGTPEPQPEPEPQTLEQARATIARQAQEIERLHQTLQRTLAAERFAEELRKALATASAAGTIASPVTHTRLLEMIVQTAAHVIGANAASLFLIDEEHHRLTFEVATGPKAAQVKHFTVPLGTGIAGLVAISGQPMAISDAQHDPRHASDFARQVGYSPQSILCVPLMCNEEITGVLELLDKKGASSFSAEDMELLGYFANQAAVAIEQSRTHSNLGALIVEVLDSLGGLDDHSKETLRQEAGSFAGRTESDPRYRQAVELARLVQTISWQGEREAQLCRSILSSFADYLSSSARAATYGAGVTYDERGHPWGTW
jgi:transcriptional regulator with GAF, ATPase, and Fis domain